jgi:hypothetical protein
MDVPPPKQDCPPTSPVDEPNEAPDSPHDAMSRPWPQTRWSEGQSPPVDHDDDATDERRDSTTKPWPRAKWSVGRPPCDSMRDNPAYEKFYLGTENNNGPEAPEGFVEFDDVTPVGTLEENDDDAGRAQGVDEIDDTSSNSSGPAEMVNSTSDDEDDEGVRGRNILPDDSDDEDEEIGQLTFGDIPREDDDLGSFVRHPKTWMRYTRGTSSTPQRRQRVCDTWRFISRSYALVIHVEVPRLCEHDASVQVKRHGNTFIKSRLRSRIR